MDIFVEFERLINFGLKNKLFEKRRRNFYEKFSYRII